MTDIEEKIAKAEEEIRQFADLERGGAGSRSCQEMRGTGNTAEADQRKDAE